jgi:hypothetical protein
MLHRGNSQLLIVKNAAITTLLRYSAEQNIQCMGCRLQEGCAAFVPMPADNLLSDMVS